jgi:hypothetical protein
MLIVRLVLYGDSWETCFPFIFTITTYRKTNAYAKSILLKDMISDYADNYENCQGAEKIADALKDNRSITTLDLVKKLLCVCLC